MLQLLSPLPHVPIVYGVGVNYKLYIEESGVGLP
jgi:hypothetical protein